MHRYTNIELPAYKYIPGQSLHPSRLENIVHIPETEDDLAAFSYRSWHSSEKYLYAIDLFNLGYYWEVHEVLEQIWMSAGKTSEEGVFIQGLIQLSVALLKHILGNQVGVERLSRKALPKILSQKGTYLGININKLVEEFDLFIAEKQLASPKILLSID